MSKIKKKSNQTCSHKDQKDDLVGKDGAASLTLSSVSGSQMGKERTDLCKLFSVLHVHICFPPQINNNGNEKH